MYAGRIYVDLQNLDDENRVRLNCAGTLSDLKSEQPEADSIVSFYTDDVNDTGVFDPLLCEGRIVYDDRGEPVAVIDWARLRHASDEICSLKKRFFDTAIGDMLRALDGDALIGSTLLGLCVLDSLGFLSTNRGEMDDFKAIVKKYLVQLNSDYDPDWLWEVRNGLAHVHGASRKLQKGKQPLGVRFTHLHPEQHLLHEGNRRVLNVESFMVDVITTAWKAFEDYRAVPEQPIQAYSFLLMVLQSDTAADKPYGDMHRLLAQLDSVPLRPESLANDIRQSLQERAHKERKSA